MAKYSRLYMTMIAEFDLRLVISETAKSCLRFGLKKLLNGHGRRSVCKPQSLHSHCSSIDWIARRATTIWFFLENATRQQAWRQLARRPEKFVPGHVLPALKPTSSWMRTKRAGVLDSVGARKHGWFGALALLRAPAFIRFGKFALSQGAFT
jgi:hypothetical protein